MVRYTKIGFAIMLGFFVAQIWGCSADTHVPIGHAKMRFPTSELESIYGAMNEVSLEKGLVFSSETRRIDGQVAAIATIEKNGCVAALAYGYKSTTGRKSIFINARTLIQTPLPAPF